MPTEEKRLPKITKHMFLADVVQKYPQTAEVFMRHGLHCFGCHVAMFETIEQGAMAHLMDADKLVQDLNDAILGPTPKKAAKKKSVKKKLAKKPKKKPTKTLKKKKRKK